MSTQETSPPPVCTGKYHTPEMATPQPVSPSIGTGIATPNRATRRAAARGKESRQNPTGVGPVVGLREAAEHVGMSLYTLRDWIKAGRLPAYRLGQRWRVRIADLEQLLVKNETL